MAARKLIQSADWWSISPTKLTATTTSIEVPKNQLDIGGVAYSGQRSSSTNEVNARRVRLQLGWVTVFGRVYHLGL